MVRLMMSLYLLYTADRLQAAAAAAADCQPMTTLSRDLHGSVIIIVINQLKLAI